MKKKDITLEGLLKKDKAYTLVRNISIIASAVGIVSFLVTPLLSTAINLSPNAWKAIISAEYLGLGVGGCAISFISNLKHKQLQHEINNQIINKNNPAGLDYELDDL